MSEEERNGLIKQRRLLREKCEKKDKEIERLNNIIKEQGLEDKPNYYVKGLEGSLKEYQEEIKRLNNIINKKEQFLGDNIKRLEREVVKRDNIINELNTAYCKVITKCEEMINSRFYMNDIAIKKYADEIKDICRYYVGKAKELKGSGKE